MAIPTGWYSSYSGSGASSVGSPSSEQAANDVYSSYLANNANLYTRGYGILPGHATITGIEIQLDAKADSGTDPNDYFEVDLSWNGGTNYTATKRVPTSGGLGTTENTYILGGENDDWGHTWTLAEITGATTFRIRVTYKKSTGNGNIDLRAVRVFHGLPVTGNLEIVVASSDDDGYEVVGGSGWNAATTGAGFGYDNLNDDEIAFGVAFRNIPILPGSVIKSAYLVVANEPASANYAIQTKIIGIDVDDFSLFDNTTSKPSDHTSANPTTAQVDWDLTTGDVWAASMYYASPDIKTIIQEIIDRGGWASGNDIGLVVRNDGGTDYRTIATQSYRQPPVLVIDYVSAVSERAAKVRGEIAVNVERIAMAAGGDGRYVEHFANTDKKDAVNTTANWPGDGTARMNTD